MLSISEAATVAATSLRPARRRRTDPALLVISARSLGAIYAELDGCISALAETSAWKPSLRRIVFDVFSMGVDRR